MGAGGGRHPDDFEIEANQKIKVIKANSTFSRHQPNMCGRFTLYSTCEREGKIWHWYLLRRVAVCLEPCASLPGIEFGVQSLRQFARTKATTVM